MRILQRGGLLQPDMARAFLEMDKANVRRTRFGCGVYGGDVRQATDFDLGFHQLGIKNCISNRSNSCSFSKVTVSFL